MASEYLLPFQPSIGSATNTRVDSACKHHHQCRVSTDDMLQMLTPQNDQKELQRNKFRYCVHKDELVLSVGRPWLPAEARKLMNNAYPRVISNLGMWDGTTDESKNIIKMIKYMYHYCRGINDKEHIINFFKNTEPVHPLSPANARYLTFDPTRKDDPPKLVKNIFDWHCMGYAQTLGWAHYHDGDTMTTVMIGGLRTVMNGDFEIYTNDIVQWYFPFERDCFHADGRRKKFGKNMEPPAGGGNFQHCNINPAIEWDYRVNAAGAPRVQQDDNIFVLPKDAVARHTMHDKVYGMEPGIQKMVPRIKPFYYDDVNPRMYDHVRCFARAIGCARPHEMVDIQIFRQSV